MSITDRLDETMRLLGQEFAGDENFQKAQELLKQMKELNVLQPSTYTLPPVDTIGMKLYGATTCNCDCK